MPDNAVPSRVALLAEAIHDVACCKEPGAWDVPRWHKAAAVAERFVVEAEAQARTEGYEQAIADVHKAQDKAYRLAAGTDA